MISIARLVSSSETRTDASAGPRTSAPHCHVPMRASSAVNGYSSISAKKAAPVRVIQWRGVRMRGEERRLRADHIYPGEKLPPLLPLKATLQKPLRLSRSAHL